MKPEKTFKREVAVLIIIFLGVVIWQAAQNDPVETLKVIIWPAMLFVGAAFGMDWATKQQGKKP